MPDSRLQRTRIAYDDPINRIARIYLQHGSRLMHDGRNVEAREAIEEVERILGLPLGEGSVAWNRGRPDCVAPTPSPEETQDRRTQPINAMPPLWGRPY